MGLTNSQNENTLVYIVNALNGEVRKVSGIASSARSLADENKQNLKEVDIQIGETQETLLAAIDARADVIILQAQAYTDAELVSSSDEINGTIALLESRTSTVEQTATSLTTTFEQQVNPDITNLNSQMQEMQTYIQQDASGATIGRRDSDVTVRVGSFAVDGIMMQGFAIYNEGKVVTYWDNEAQLTPDRLKIPQGGSLTMGNYRWIPRSNGNLSLVYVG